MADRTGCSVGGRDSICVDVNRIFDSCRDKDCFENVRAYLTECGQDIIDKTSNVRVKCATVAGTQLTVEPVQFNRGFFQVLIRFYVKLVCEGCVFPGKPQEFEGFAVCEKKVILFGSEGCVKVFRSDPLNNGFCSSPNDNTGNTNLPIAVCEVADPVVLDVDVCEKKKACDCCCCCCVDEIPDNICGCANGTLVDPYDDVKGMYVTLGFFTVCRIERPSQCIINATEYCVPDKECISAEDNDPCALFKKMSFPVSEFCPPSFKQLNC